MNRIAWRPGIQTGLMLSDRESVTRIGVPPLAGTTRIELGARFPLRLNCQFPLTMAIHLPSEDQAGEWKNGP
jgi:hypothetical protein